MNGKLSSLGRFEMSRGMVFTDMDPSGLRTAVAAPRRPLIMTPSITAWPP